MPSFQVAYSLDQSFLNFKETVNLLGDSVVKNLPANAGDMGSILCHEDSLKEKMATTPVLLPGESPRTKEHGGLSVHGVAKSQTQLSD